MATRLITISWTAPSISTGILGYNLYLCQGSPENTTKTLLAFVNGVNNTTYTYTGTEGIQYQFEVRSTDNTTESPPLEIFYPNGTSLYTPTVITPTGQPMMIVRDSQYLSKDDFLNYPNGLKLTTSSALYTSGVLDQILQMASEEVNRYCRRHFDTQTIDEVYDGVRISQDYPKMVSIPLNEGPIQNVIRIDLQVLQYFISFSLQYLQVFPDKNYIQIVPYLGGSATGIPLPAAVLTEGILAKIWTRYTFGYDVMPNAVKMATSLYATEMIGLQENPAGAKEVRLGKNWQLQWDTNHNPLFNKVKQLLDPYRVFTFRRP